MKKTTKIVFAVVSLVAGLFAVCAYMLFHGYLDAGKFDVRQEEWNSKKVAMLILRTDEAALGGYNAFVLIGDHPYSPIEIKHRYHSDAVVFAAAADCLSLHWASETSLIVECKGSFVDPWQINALKRQSEGVAITYRNIAQ